MKPSPNAGGDAPHPAVAFILKGYPRLSETFIAREILGLEQRGLDIRIVSLRHPTDAAVHPVHRCIRAPLSYLPEYLYREPARVLRGWWASRRRPGYRAVRTLWLRDLRRDPTGNRIRRFGQALVLAAELPAEVTHLHAHFLHTPASVARYASGLTGLPWSCSAHAKDIWTSPEWEKREKLADCRWAVTCTAVNLEHLQRLAPRPDTVELVYHGLDLRSFPPSSRPPSRRDGSRPEDPVRILSVGRAVEKKGYDDLLESLALLPAGLSWRFVHIGGGPLRRRLEREAVRLGIDERVVWLGPRPQREVLSEYTEADLFALACRVAGDGDRDGLPNVLVEAQSQSLACVATRVSAIPELIGDEVNGLLVAPSDRAGLAAAIERMVRNPELRARLGAAGNARVREAFSSEAGLCRLFAKFAGAGVES